jgi:hypothetical protein
MRTVHAVEQMTVQWEMVTKIGEEQDVCPICEKRIQTFANYIFSTDGQKITVCWKCNDRIFKDAKSALIETKSIQ